MISKDFHTKKVYLIRMTNNIAYVLCGYKRSGKDTFYENMQEGNVNKWIMYSLDSEAFVLLVGRRISFADSLKKEVACSLNLDPNTDFESIKDIIIKDIAIKDGKTFRDFLIERGSEARNIDENHWTKIALSSISGECTEGTRNKGNIVITDARYPSEIEYVSKRYNVTSIRIFRSCVTIPDINDTSEHSLDSYITNYVAVKSEDDFEYMKTLFPMYSKYKRVNQVRIFA